MIEESIYKEILDPSRELFLSGSLEREWERAALHRETDGALIGDLSAHVSNRVCRELAAHGCRDDIVSADKTFRFRTGVGDS